MSHNFFLLSFVPALETPFQAQQIVAFLKDNEYSFSDALFFENGDLLLNLRKPTSSLEIKACLNPIFGKRQPRVFALISNPAAHAGLPTNLINLLKSQTPEEPSMRIPPYRPQDKPENCSNVVSFTRKRHAELKS